MPNKKVAVLGAGISGLSTGYALKKRGFDVTVFEKNQTPGGVIQTQKQNGWLVEEGPNTIMVREKEVWDFFKALNITQHIQEAGRHAKKRFIVRNGKLHAVPNSLISFLSTSLISPPAKLRLLKEPFVKSSNKEDESLVSFIKRRFGKEPLDYGINPFIAGVYAGDPEKLSAKHTLSTLYKMEREHGSVLKGLMTKKKKGTTKKALISFDEGLQVLTDRLSDELDVSLQLNTEVVHINKKDNEWLVHTNAVEQTAVHQYSTVVSTLPPSRLLKIWGETHSGKALNKLSTIEYVPVCVLALGFRNEQINHPLDGFGFLVPEKEDFNILGCLFSSSLFRNRVPGGHALLTCFIGGARSPGLAGLPVEKLVPKVMGDLKMLLGMEGEPVFINHRYWAKAIPQFNVGHDAFLNAAAEIEDENPGFFIDGNFIHGVSVPDCILSSFEMAERV